MLFFGFFRKRFAPVNRSDGMIYGSFLNRYLAAVLDLSLIALVGLWSSSIWSLIFGDAPRPSLDLNAMISLDLALKAESAQSLINVHTIGQAIQAALALSYFYFFWSCLSTTPGKMLLGMVIVDESGSRLNKKTSLKRLFGGIVTIGTLLGGFFMVAVTKNRQALHDKMAGTYVVTRKSAIKAGNFLSGFYRSTSPNTRSIDPNMAGTSAK